MSDRHLRWARVLTTVGLVASVGYLVWRGTRTLDGRPMWLSVSALGVETAGALGSGLLAWALWHRPAGGVAPPVQCDPDDEALDVVVRIDEQLPHELRATLIALADTRSVRSVIVADLTGGRMARHPSIDPIGRLARSHGARVVVVADEQRTMDPGGLVPIVDAVSTSAFLLLDAGDVPAPDAVDVLRRSFATTRSVRSMELDGTTSTVTCAAVVQGRLDSAAIGSPEHGPDGRHDLVFETAVLGPVLGRRGLAVWSGSGSLVRTTALRSALDVVQASTTLLHAPRSVLEQHSRLTREFFIAGWAVTAPPEVVVARRTILDESAVYADRVARARAARSLVLGPAGVVRTRTPRLHLGHRLALLAWSVRPLSGTRRAVFVTLVCASLVAGIPPLGVGSVAEASWAFGGLWLPAVVATSAGLWRLSGGVLRPGDRARWSMHTLGPSVSGVRGADLDAMRRRAPILELPHMQYGAGMVVAIVAVSTVMAMRGVSDRLTHTLGVLDRWSLIGLLGICAWLLGLSLYMLGVLTRRSQGRTAVRVATDLAGSLGGVDVSVVDLTPLGAGVVGTAAPEVGDETMLTIHLGDGRRSLELPCTVCNVAADGDDRWRLGVRFDPWLVPPTADAVTEYSMVGPMRAHLDGLRVHGRGAVVSIGRPGSQRGSQIAIRLLTAVAMAGAIASAIPQP